MRRRIYFLVPDKDRARTVVRELLLARIEDRNMHVIARQDMPLEDLPKPALPARSELKESLMRGLAVGGITGAVAGLIAVNFPPAGLALGGSLVAVTTFAGAIFGAWASSMIGISEPKREIEAFETEIRRGKLLMMSDVPRRRVEEIKRLIRSKVPEARFGGMASRKPIFP